MGGPGEVRRGPGRKESEMAEKKKAKGIKVAAASLAMVGVGSGVALAARSPGTSGGGWGGGGEEGQGEQGRCGVVGDGGGGLWGRPRGDDPRHERRGGAARHGP